MKWLQAIRQYVPSHKYAINSRLLGDDAELAWSNLGYWDDAKSSYPAACQKLALYLAESIQLKSTDRVLDLGCGQGASLVFWMEHFQIQNLSAVELQTECVEKIQKNLNSKIKIQQDSFLNLKNIYPQNCMDAVLCIDAAYHSDLNLLLLSIFHVLNSKGRFAFHYLMLSDTFLNLNSLQRLKYQSLLKAADVNLKNLNSKQNLQHQVQQAGFENIQIEDISEFVFQGFADYIQEQKSQMSLSHVDQFKIKMTAKLCEKLYRDGLIRYVQISARKP
ncbi:methyltransferase domain-containing protein [Acinetobacter sp. YH12138]|uniref:SAM-dependent methyltransferase n=1 Tax=Acinetobacter sp. YH12138 TaxID=2601122 RepID=UPI0015D3B7A4|nr:class I SAM-dependent methyltransferase [Acinetobacter sp. YH12138]QOW48486.1 methyltransferase domain-containing protein [Acinetobacter sp. YH12138]